MKKVSRRAFSGALLSASALAAQERGQPATSAPLDLPAWNGFSAGGDAFEFPGPPSPRTRWNVPGPPRKYFSEWLPALFERTLEMDEWSANQPPLRWIFTGPCGGFTVEAGGGKASLTVRYYDSPGLAKVPPVQPRPGRHPEDLFEETSVEYRGELKTITVVADHRLTLSVRLNGKEALTSRAAPDVNQHQLAFTGLEGAARGRLLPPALETAAVTVDDAVRFQEMLGWGGTTTPPAFAELMRFEVDRTRQLFDQGTPLLDRVPADVQLDIELFLQGGLAILGKIERCGYNVWDSRPALAKWEKAGLLASACFRRVRGVLF